MHTELAKYSTYKAERLAIFEMLMQAGVTPSQLESTSEAFNLIADGDADVMMGLWRETRDRMSE